MKLGIFGGTLDPPHLGHLRVGEEVYELLGLNEVWFLPAYRPPHKLNKPLTSFDHRLRMTELALEGIAYFKASGLEAERGDISYSVDLLRWIHKEVPPETRLFFIVGADAALEIHLWKHYLGLPRLAQLVVVKRPPHSLEEVKKRLVEVFPGVGIQMIRDVPDGDIPQGSILLLETTSLAISSTDIRKRVREGRSIRFLVPEGVREYIAMNRLYLRSEEGQGTPEQGSVRIEPLNSMEMAWHIQDQILDNKGEEVVILDMRGISPVADFFIIAQGRSTRHVQGMANRMKRELSRKGIKCRSVEGEEEGKWVLMDFDDVVVHLFYEPVRSFYDLEGLWHEAPRLVPRGNVLVSEDEEDEKD